MVLEESVHSCWGWLESQKDMAQRKNTLDYQRITYSMELIPWHGLTFGFHIKKKLCLPRRPRRGCFVRCGMGWWHFGGFAWSRTNATAVRCQDFEVLYELFSTIGLRDEKSRVNPGCFRCLMPAGEAVMGNHDIVPPLHSHYFLRHYRNSFRNRKNESKRWARGNMAIGYHEIITTTCINFQKRCRATTSKQYQNVK